MASIKRGWSTKLGASSDDYGIVSPPSLSEGTLYVTPDTRRVLALGARRGVLRWGRSSYRPGTGCGPGTSPAVSEGLVFRSYEPCLVSSGGGFVASDGSTGKTLWGQANGNFSPPTVAAGVVYVSYDPGETGGGNPSLQALRPNGDVIWTLVSPDFSAFGTPSVDGSLVFVWRSNHVYALDSSSGATVWSTSVPGTYASVYVQTLVSGGTVYACTNDHIAALNEATGDVLWTRASDGGECAVADATLYVASYAGVGGEA